MVLGETINETISFIVTAFVVWIVLAEVSRMRKELDEATIKCHN